MCIILGLKKNAFLNKKTLTYTILWKKEKGNCMEKDVRPLRLQQITITDSLFGHYIKKVSDVMLEYQWKILNDDAADTDPTGCIQNFRIAAGLSEGERVGVVFQDTDLYKWIESAAYCIACGVKKDFEEKIDEVVDVLEMAQEEDGYLNTYFQVKEPDGKWTNLVEGHELYTSGHMIEAAVAYTQATGKDKFLKIAIKNADLICRIFGNKKGQIQGVPGHEEIELSLVKLYHMTGDRKYLIQADYFVRQRGQAPNYLQKEIDSRKKPQFFPEFSNYSMIYAQADKPPIQQTEAEGHAVRATYLYSAMTDLALLEKDLEMEKACDALWESMVNRRMYITGGIGSSGFLECFTTDYDLPNTTNYCETCASVGVMMFGQRMAALKKDASYYDTVERALYNTILAAMNLEGNRYFYVNPLEMVPEFCTADTYMNHVKPIRQKWFNVACCPPNLARTLASLGQYIYSTDEDSIYINQFITSNARLSLNDSEVMIDVSSALLQEGRISIKCKSEKGLKIKIRIPLYAKDPELIVDGKRTVMDKERNYAKLKLSKGEHSIVFELNTTPKFVAANQKVRVDVGKVAIVNGPMVYCLEEADNGSNLSSIFVSPSAILGKDKPLDRFPGEVPVFQYEGTRVENIDTTDDALYREAGFVKRPVKIRAVPYAFWNNRGIGEMKVWQNMLV